MNKADAISRADAITQMCKLANQSSIDITTPNHCDFISSAYQVHRIVWYALSFQYLQLSHRWYPYQLNETTWISKL